MQARLRIFWALAISLLLHFWLISDTEFSLPDWEPMSAPIQVNIQPKIVSTHSHENPLEKKIIRPKIPQLIPDFPKPTHPSASQPKPDSAQITAPLPLNSNTPTSDVSTTPIRAPEESVAESIPLPEDTFLAPAEEEMPTVLPPPKRVEIDFRGANGSKGEGTQRFELGENGHYKLHSEMSMPVFLFVSGKMEQTSEGLVTEHGLQPLTFYQKTTGSKALTATFNWAEKHVSLEGKRQETIDLPPSTQDLLSFMYQFMFVPPLNEMRLSVLTGKKLKTYVYEFEGEDSLSTPAGTFKSAHIAKSNQDGDEKTELWLAADYRYLPIRIKKTEKDGTTYDLVVNRITLTE